MQVSSRCFPEPSGSGKHREQVILVSEMNITRKSTCPGFGVQERNSSYIFYLPIKNCFYYFTGAQSYKCPQADSQFSEDPK